MKDCIEMVVGIDLGDRRSHVCVLRGDGKIDKTRVVETTRQALGGCLRALPRSRVVMEAGTHSPWVSQEASEAGHEVVVADPRRLRAVSQDARKSDRKDAETLARLARSDLGLLRPVRHRSAQAQQDVALLRARDAAVRARKQVLTTVRGAVKPLGERVGSSSAESFPKKAREQLSQATCGLVEPALLAIEELTRTIRRYDEEVERICEERYPETKRLRQVAGVGALTALAFVLKIEDPARFRRRRLIGAYLGMVPGRDQSGDRSPELPISKTGDAHLRRLLVSAAHYVLGPFGPDSDLRRFGLLKAGGSKSAKKRAVVAVARRLAVLLLALWATGETYEPLRHANRAANAA